MKTHVVGSLAGAFIFGLSVLPAQGFLGPQLAQECQALVAKLEQRADTNKKKLEKAKQGCEQALRLQRAGKHKAAIIAAGKAITLAGKAANGSSASATSFGSSGGGY